MMLAVFCGLDFREHVCHFMAAARCVCFGLELSVSRYVPERKSRKGKRKNDPEKA